MTIICLSLCLISLLNLRSILQWSANSRLRWAATLSLYILSYALVVVTAPLSFFFVLHQIPEYERAVVLGSTIDLVGVLCVRNYNPLPL